MTLARGHLIPGAIPRPESLFEPVRDRHGWRLALVFGNHAPGGFCPYYTDDRCFHCDIGAGEGGAFDLATNRQRLAWFQDHYHAHLDSIGHFVVYNSGSVLNRREMPPAMLDEIIEFACNLPSVGVMSIDSREPYVTRDALRRLLSVAGAGTAIRPILGIESADDRIRNDVLHKGMPKSAINRVFADLGHLAAEFGPARIGLDVNVVIAGPGTTRSTEIDDAVATAQTALRSGLEHGFDVDLNLHPYYPGTRGLARYPDHPRCSPSTTASAAVKIADLVQSMGTGSSLFIGWNDEGHDCEPSRRRLELERAQHAFDRFNQTNDANTLTDLLAGC